MNTNNGQIQAAAPGYVRKETFLAYYPRKLKLAVAGVLLCSIAGIWSASILNKASIAPRQETPRAEQQAFESDYAKRGSSPSRTDLLVKNTQPSDPNAIAMNDTDDGSKRMAPAPDVALTEDTPDGALPKMGENGRKPWQVYARPFNTNDKRPRVAIVIVDMGLSRVASDAALRRMPASVTMAFDVQSSVVASWLGRARQDGHETLISLPMEPFDYPRSDPGPNVLLTSLPNSHILHRLNWALRQGTGYIGVTTLSGSRFTSDPTKTEVLLGVLKQRGLMAFDARVSPHSVLKELAKKDDVPVADSTLYLDKDPTPVAIDAALHQLEQAAQLDGHAVGVASPLPVTLDRLESWIKQLPNRGIALAPVSAVVE